MGASITWPTTTPNLADTHLISLQKLLQTGLSVTTTTVTGGMMSGAGDPAAAPGDPLIATDYLDTTNDRYWVWNPVSVTWVLKVA